MPAVATSVAWTRPARPASLERAHAQPQPSRRCEGGQPLDSGGYPPHAQLEQPLLIPSIKLVYGPTSFAAVGATEPCPFAPTD